MWKPQYIGGNFNICVESQISMKNAMQCLQNSGMRERLDELVLREKIPVMGVCIGMHMLATSSEEGVVPGLGWIDGTVEKFDSDVLGVNYPLPHMGWNYISHMDSGKEFLHKDKKYRFYFVHSYYVKCKDEQEVMFKTEYGTNFHSGIRNGNIIGMQFHPEKSQRFGSQLLENFLNL